jgi:hypothetical protein
MSNPEKTVYAAEEFSLEGLMNIGSESAEFDSERERTLH